MRSALRIIIFVLVMGTASGTLLIGINGFTSVQIARNEELGLKSSVLDVLEIAYQKDTILELFEKNIEVLQKDKFTFYRSPDQAVAFEFSGPGLWGPIRGIISINPDLKTVRVLKILHQEETPGLGARIAEKEYLAQFRHKTIIPKLIFMPQGRAKSDNQVDAITGATGSSKALEKLLNETIQKNIGILKG